MVVAMAVGMTIVVGTVGVDTYAFQLPTAPREGHQGWCHGGWFALSPVGMDECVFPSRQHHHRTQQKQQKQRRYYHYQQQQQLQ